MRAYHKRRTDEPVLILRAHRVQACSVIAHPTPGDNRDEARLGGTGPKSIFAGTVPSIQSVFVTFRKAVEKDATASECGEAVIPTILNGQRRFWRADNGSHVHAWLSLCETTRTHRRPRSVMRWVDNNYLWPGQAL